MSSMKKTLLSLSVLVAAVGGVRLSQVAARVTDDKGLVCVMDVVVESRTSTGVLAGSEVYHKEFVLTEGQAFSDDFSTRTRFKFFDASFQKENGDTTVDVSWFADVTVFNSVDFNTSVVLEGGDKKGKSLGNNTVFTSNGSTTTRFSLTVVEQ